jgi:hypothetical protein
MIVNVIKDLIKKPAGEMCSQSTGLNWGGPKCHSTDSNSSLLASTVHYLYTIAEECTGDSGLFAMLSKLVMQQRFIKQGKGAVESR